MKFLSQEKGFLGYDASQDLNPKVIVVPFGLEKQSVTEVEQKMVLMK